MSGPSFYLSALHGFLGAELVDRSEQVDHICGDVVEAAEDSGEMSVIVIVTVCVRACVREGR